MIDRSVAPPEAHPNPLDRIAARVEEEIARLREKRPHLEERIDRAAGIIVQHLACRRQRTIRVRLHAGHARFLVDGSNGTVYSITPTDWSCSCPDHHRRGGICKHGIAAYLVWRAAQPAVRKRTCDGCDQRFPRGEMAEVQENEQYFPGDLLCKQCADRAGVER